MIRIIREKISLEDIKELAQKTFGDLVKAVVDVEQKIMAIGGEMHADEEKMLLENGSRQENLWGINLYPETIDENWIEFDSMINVRPLQYNRSRGIDNLEIKKSIIEIVNNLVQK